MIRPGIAFSAETCGAGGGGSRVGLHVAAVQAAARRSFGLTISDGLTSVSGGGDMANPDDSELRWDVEGVYDLGAVRAQSGGELGEGLDTCAGLDTWATLELKQQGMNLEWGQEPGKVGDFGTGGEFVVLLRKSGHRTGRILIMTLLVYNFPRSF